MAATPVCNRCQTPHFNFTPCAKAKAELEQRAATKPEFQQSLDSVLTSVPDGFKRATGWGSNDGWGQPWGKAA